MALAAALGAVALGGCASSPSFLAPRFQIQVETDDYNQVELCKVALALEDEIPDPAGDRSVGGGEYPIGSVQSICEFRFKQSPVNNFAVFRARASRLQILEQASSCHALQAKWYRECNTYP